jgi:hypothetical protein
MPANLCCSLGWAATTLCACGRAVSSPADPECRIKKPITKDLHRYCAADAGKTSEPRS